MISYSPFSLSVGCERFPQSGISRSKTGEGVVVDLIRKETEFPCLRWKSKAEALLWLIPVKDSYTPEEVGYYYEGEIPQTVLINQKGDVVLNGKGQLSFEEIDDAFREVFDLLPRSESVELKRRTVNEFNVELSQ